MTRKLEDFLELQESKIEDEDQEDTEQNKTDEYEAYTEQAIDLAERIDKALPSIRGLESHDIEMDAVAKKAMEFFEDLSDRAMNMPDAHAGKIFEVASNLLKLAMEAKNFKSEKKLKMIELQLKKAKLDMEISKQSKEDENRSPNTEIHLYDRNTLLRSLNQDKS